MLDSKTKAKIDEAIKILNDLNDNEKDLVISDINKKITPFKNDGTLKNNKREKKADIKRPSNSDCSSSKDRLVVCPLCGERTVVKKGKDNKGSQRYQCNSCNKSFTNTTSTFRYKSRKDESYWNELIMGMLDGKSYSKISERTGTCVSTVHTHALKIMQQVLDNTDSQLLSGNIESDETYNTPNFKGDRGKYKFSFNGTDETVHKIPDHIRYNIPTASYIKALKRKGQSLRGLSKQKVCYATAISQDYTFCGGPVKMGNINKESLSKRLLKNLAPDVMFIGDSSKANKQFVEEYKIKHKLVISSEKSGKDEHNLQKVNYFHAQIKEKMESIHNFSTKHSEKYISFLAWNIKNRKLTDEEKITAIKSIIKKGSKVATWNDIRTTEFPVGLRGE